METSVKAGLALVGAAAVVVAGSMALSQKSPAGVFELTAGGVGLIASTVKQGKSAVAVAIGTGSGIVASEACKTFLTTLDEEPAKEQPIKVTTDTGVIEDHISRPDLTAEPPAPSAADRQARFALVLRCFKSYDTALVRKWCYEGKIQPLVSE
jgi:hypothetical protein